METSNKLMNLRTLPHTTTRDNSLPPKASLPTTMSVSSATSLLGSDTTTNINSVNPMEAKISHQRCSSDIFLVEQPSWLDDLLSEPETLLTQPKGHRRSASDSSTYFGSIFQDVRANGRAPQGNNSKDHHNAVTFTDPWNSSLLNKIPSSTGNKYHSSTGSDSSANSVVCFSGGSRQSSMFQNSLLPSAPKELENSASAAPKKHDQVDDSGDVNNESYTEKGDTRPTKPNSMSKAEAKRAKQQSAHRSRVRKLQYIADLERSVQILQAEGTEVSAQLEFLDQQNLILGMENGALRQRLDSLSQEHLIKHMEQEMLEKEIARLQTLYQIQMQQQKQQHHQQLHNPKHRRKQSNKVRGVLAET